MGHNVAYFGSNDFNRFLGPDKSMAQEKLGMLSKFKEGNMTDWSGEFLLPEYANYEVRQAIKRIVDYGKVYISYRRYITITNTGNVRPMKILATAGLDIESHVLYIMNNVFCIETKLGIDKEINDKSGAYGKVDDNTGHTGRYLMVCDPSYYMNFSATKKKMERDLMIYSMIATESLTLEDMRPKI